ncbi:MAG TPA: dynamin family protein [Ruania sp.]|nr:dynamin family protein [Ruania sp.]
MDAALRALREAVEGARLPLQLPGADAARRDRALLLDQLEDYLLPRAASLDAPLLAVVGGSTGAGKSTLVNALVGDVLTRTGAIRPTTRDPVLIHHPHDAHWFTEPRILPHLPRLRSTPVGQEPATGQGTAAGEGTTPGREPRTGASQVLRLTASAAVGPGLALLDAPDIDSVVDANRHLATQLLAAADLWLFVTTAHRYADAVPWDLLTTAAERDVVVAVVLDRIPPPVLREVSDDLAGMLADHGLGRAPLFLLTETDLDVRGMLPPEAVGDLHRWLTSLTDDAAARTEVARRTLVGAVRSATAAAGSLAASVGEQAVATEEMADQLAQVFDVTELLTRVTDGALLRGEVLSRWQDFVGTGELFRSVESTVGRLRDRATAFLTGRPRPARRVEHALEQGLHSVLVEQADQAAHRAYTHLWQQPAGRPLLPGPELERAEATFSADAAAAIRQWQRFVLELVRTEGQDKRATARVLAFGVNSLAVVLMVLAFASTGGLVGAEVAIAGGTAVVAQKLLEAIFGDQAVRRLATRARADLTERVTALFEAERDRFTALLPDAAMARTAAERLRAAGADLDSAAACLEAGSRHPEDPR